MQLHYVYHSTKVLPTYFTENYEIAIKTLITSLWNILPSKDSRQF